MKINEAKARGRDFMYSNIFFILTPIYDGLLRRLRLLAMTYLLCHCYNLFHPSLRAEKRRGNPYAMLPMTCFTLQFAP